ncbi:MAG: hypothetical protein HYY16_18255 [Planctomycetes bacterium]|nr:hypothetical protein [Planctomycetota bacterium]
MSRLWPWFLSSAALAGLWACGGGSGGGSSPAGGGGLPAGLPALFALGLSSQPGDQTWMAGSGVPWNYRYQYLAGGVNTGGGWSTWNSPPGQFATYYMDSSAAAGYIPVFTYYMIVQSAPNPGDEDVAPKLANTSTMNAYYGDFKLLMQKCGAFGGVVVVHVEPDLWGFMQQSATSDDPTTVPVAVASSGFAEAAGLPDNARGFAQTLLALRQAYAPNCILAWHASHWSAGADLVLSDSDPVPLATRTADFFLALQANYDLLFVDPSDRDLGFYQHVYGDGGAHRWDAADFERYRGWIATLSARTARKVMLWQVPCGNTLYRSCDNTWGHYQDNRPEYFLQAGHRPNIEAYAAAGAIGILFGGGADGTTGIRDTRGDGVTNPPAINGNTLQATLPDDDGGFLRTSAAAYYSEGPVSLP